MGWGAVGWDEVGCGAVGWGAVGWGAVRWVRCGGVGCGGVGWGGVGCGEVPWDGVGWDAVRCGGVRWGGVGCGGVGWGAVGWCLPPRGVSVIPGCPAGSDWRQPPPRGLRVEPPPLHRLPPRRRSQFLAEPGLAAGLEVADDDAELPNVLHELLQVLLQVVKLLRHRQLRPPPLGRGSSQRLELRSRAPASGFRTPTSVSSGGRAGPPRGRGLVAAGRGQARLNPLAGRRLK